MCTENKKAPAGVEPTISCLLDRRFNQLSHGAILQTSGKVREKKFVLSSSKLACCFVIHLTIEMVVEWVFNLLAHLYGSDGD